MLFRFAINPWFAGLHFFPFVQSVFAFVLMLYINHLDCSNQLSHKDCSHNPTFLNPLYPTFSPIAFLHSIVNISAHIRTFKYLPTDFNHSFILPHTQTQLKYKSHILLPFPHTWFPSFSKHYPICVVVLLRC